VPAMPCIDTVPSCIIILQAGQAAVATTAQPDQASE
jgi:hypothetical protein